VLREEQKSQEPGQRGDWKYLQDGEQGKSGKSVRKKSDSALLTMTERRGRRGGNEGKLWRRQE